MARARRNPRREDVGLFQVVLAYLRALQWFSWTFHWQTSGPNYYGDHLLLQRLYQGEGGGPNINDSIDALGERLVAHFGPQSVDPKTINAMVQKILEAVPKTGFAGLLDMEDGLRNSVVKAWKANQKAGEEMSLGLDDYLMALANERETVEYLLQQRLRS